MVYFIQCGGKNGPIKIGQTNNNIKERISQLQTGCPYELKLLWLYKGDRFTESEIHEKFKHENIRGEWYHPSRALFNFLGEEMQNSGVFITQSPEREYWITEYFNEGKGESVTVTNGFAEIRFFELDYPEFKNEVYISRDFRAPLNVVLEDGTERVLRPPVRK